jgi:multidrug efflux pump subunit AcrA (membrane-fusion protein)
MPRASWRSVSRSTIINAVLALAVLVVVGLAVRAVTAGDTQTASSRTTTSVSTGNVVATVTASGNVAAMSTVAVDFSDASQVVRAILVEEGDHVRKGQVLARIDQTSAHQTLRSAQIQLRAAQASYAETASGETSAEQAVDRASITSAQRSVTNAELSLRQAQQTYRLNRSQADAAVARAERTATAAATAVDRAQAAYDADPTADNKTALQTAKSALSAARTALTTAKEQRAQTLLSGQQQIRTQQAQLASAREQLAAARANVSLNQQGATASQLANAQASVDTAQVTVDQAQTALEDTVLRAPVAGTVAAINGSVGQTASGSSSSSSSTSTSTTSTTTSGFVTLTSTHALEVTTYVAEADIDSVHEGQAATVTLSASDTDIKGEVTSVATVQTVTNNVVEYAVTVRLDETKGVKLGASSEVVITTGSKDDVLRVSTSALTTVGNTTTATVQHDDGTTEVVQVEIGLQGDSDTQVVSGLADGDVVVIPESDDSSTGFTFPGAPAGGLGGGPQ